MFVCNCSDTFIIKERNLIHTKFSNLLSLTPLLLENLKKGKNTSKAVLWIMATLKTTEHWL